MSGPRALTTCWIDEAVDARPARSARRGCCRSVSQKAVKSGTEPGSVASTSSVAPLGSSDSAFLVFRIGSGTGETLGIQRLVGHCARLPGIGSRSLYQRMRRRGNDWPPLGLRSRRLRLPAAACAQALGRGQPCLANAGRRQAGLRGGEWTPARTHRDGPLRSGWSGRSLGLRAPAVTFALVVLVSALAVWGLLLLRVDDSLSELFRTDTEEFRRYEEIDRRFPSSEYDVLVVVEGKDLLKKPQLEAFRRAIIDLQLADGVDGLVSMLSARGKPDASGYAPPIVPDDLPDGPDVRRHHRGDARPTRSSRASSCRPTASWRWPCSRSTARRCRSRAPRRSSAASTRLLASELAPVGLKSHLTGAPVMQLEIRNAVERDQLVYNGLGPAVRRHHRRDLLQARVADAAGGAAAGAGGAVVAGPARLARASSSTCSSTS